MQECSSFGAYWTPTFILLDADRTERYRFCGFLPSEELIPRLAFGLAMASFLCRDFASALAGFEQVAAEHPASFAAPEAVYWAAASAYSQSADAEFLEKGGLELRERYPQSEWALKSSVWLPKM